MSLIVVLAPVQGELVKETLVVHRLYSKSTIILNEWTLILNECNLPLNEYPLTLT